MIEMQKAVLIFSFVIISLGGLAQVHKDSLTTFQFECNSKKMEIRVPVGYIEADFDYSDGGRWEVEYADESSISILCDTAKNINIKKDRNPNLVYRKVVVKGYQVIYEDVPKEKVGVFEKAFSLLESDLKE